MWPPNSPDLNPVDYCVWSALEQNVYRRRFENIIELKKAILQKWEALRQAVINNSIDGFRFRVRLVIAENGQHIEKFSKIRLFFWQIKKHKNNLQTVIFFCKADVSSARAADNPAS